MTLTRWLSVGYWCQCIQLVSSQVFHGLNKGTNGKTEKARESRKTSKEVPDVHVLAETYVKEVQSGKILRKEQIPSVHSLYF